MERNKLNYLIDIGLGISFLSVFTTGVIKFPGLLRSIGLHATQLPMREISRLHDWSGVVMGVLVFVHLILHWKWIVAMTKRIFRRKK